MSFSEGIALLVGIADYQFIGKIPSAVSRDAEDVAHILKAPEYAGYSDHNVRLRLNEQATLDEMRAGLEWLCVNATDQSTALFYFSGHGARYGVSPGAVNYLLPYDCDLSLPGATALSGEELRGYIEKLKAPRVLLIFDCCFAGGIVKGAAAGGMPGVKNGLAVHYYEQLARGDGRVVIASSGAEEYSYVFPGMQNSLFTHYLLEALRGQGPQRGDGLIRVFDLFDHISENVPNRQPRQHPLFKTSDLHHNFAVALSTAGLPPGKIALPVTTVQKSALREQLNSSFSLGELRNLCQDIEQDLKSHQILDPVNLEILDGENKLDKVRELIEYLDRRRLLAYLTAAARRARPGIF
jgi:hypothetical protein